MLREGENFGPARKYVVYLNEFIIVGMKRKAQIKRTLGYKIKST